MGRGGSGGGSGGLEGYFCASGTLKRVCLLLVEVIVPIFGFVSFQAFSSSWSAAGALLVQVISTEVGVNPKPLRDSGGAAWWPSRPATHAPRPHALYRLNAPSE